MSCFSRLGSAPDLATLSQLEVVDMDKGRALNSTERGLRRIQTHFLICQIKRRHYYSSAASGEAKNTQFYSFYCPNKGSVVTPFALDSRCAAEVTVHLRLADISVCLYLKHLLQMHLCAGALKRPRQEKLHLTGQAHHMVHQMGAN